MSLAMRLLMAGGADPDAAAYMAAMSVAPSATRRTLINDFIVGLKTDGLWSKLSWISLLAAHDSQAARLNAKNPAQSFTANGSPTFTTDRGYQGNGTSAYLDAGGTFSSGGLYSQNSASFTIYVNSSGAGTWYLADGDANTVGGYFLTNALTTITAYMNDSTGVLKTGLASATLGCLTVSRTASNAIALYRNAVSQDSKTTASSGVPTGNVRLLSASGAFGTHRDAFACWGAGLTPTEAANLSSRVTTFLTAIGAN